MEKKKRFSLLLLDPGEYYFEDYIASLEISKSNTFLSGRLKVCSFSLIFDPSDFNKPILKIPFSQIGSITKSSDQDNSTLNILSNQLVEILENNVIKPYKFINEISIFIIHLKNTSVDNVLPLIQQLLQAISLQTSEHRLLVSSIAYNKQMLIKFDLTLLESGENVILEMISQQIIPLCVDPGKIVLTNLHLYFQPINNDETTFNLKIKLSEIKQVIKRKFLLQQIALEIKYEHSKELYLTFMNTESRDNLYCSLLNHTKITAEKYENCLMTLKWQNGALSNYDYLCYLNSLADRTVNDLTQYPIFPWIVADYSSKSLDLTNTKTFRDLKKPIGALNPDRLIKLKERYDEMNSPKFLYGSHYSTPGFVLFYIVRKCPLYMLCLQNGKFDHPDRMFNSVLDTWKNVLSNMSDFKELIPEFYDTEQCCNFLTNNYDIDFGYRHDGRKVGDVDLPPWSKSPKEFIFKLRQALESDYVSRNIHHWIDLIFGFKQNGRESVKANNVFYYLCYDGAINLNDVQDLNEKYALQTQIIEFGQTPKQIFKKPHPPKTCLLTNDFKQLGISSKIDLCWNWNNISVTKLFATRSHKEAVVSVKLSNDKQTVWSVGRNAVLKAHCLSSQKQLLSVIVKEFPVKFNDIVIPSIFSSTVLIGTENGILVVYDIDCCRVVTDFQVHEDSISCLAWSKNGFLLTGSLDCLVRVWKFPPGPWSQIDLMTYLKAELTHENKITSLALSLNEKLLAVGTNVGELCLWSFIDYSFIKQLPGHLNSVNKISFSSDCLKLISCSDDCCFKVFDTISGLEMYTSNLQIPLKCLACDNLHFVVGGQNGILYFWNLEKYKLVYEVKTHSGGLLSIDVSNDGSILSTAGEDNFVYIWQISCSK